VQEPRRRFRLSAQRRRTRNAAFARRPAKRSKSSARRPRGESSDAAASLGVQSQAGSSRCFTRTRGRDMTRIRFMAGWVFVAVLVAPAAAAEKPFRYPEGKHGKGELKYVNGVPVLTVEGTPEEIGAQIGVLAIKPVGGFEKLFKEFLKFQRAEKLWPFLVKACTTLYKRMPADHVKEIEALAKASGVDHDLLVVANTIMDV